MQNLGKFSVLTFLAIGCVPPQLLRNPRRCPSAFSAVSSLLAFPDSLTQS
jgi:hypothetical protein